MIRNKLFGIGLIITLIISVSFIGCGGDDDDDVAGSGGGGGAGSSGSGGTENAGSSPQQTYNFTGWVQDTASADVRPEGMTVRALSNDLNLTPLAPDTTTAAGGTFSFDNLEPDKMCIQVVGIEGDEGRIDTYTCNVDTNEKDRFVVSTTYQLAKQISDGILGDKADPNLASASGAVYYKDENGKDQPVNCATVEVDPAGPDTFVVYFAGALPNPQLTRTDSGGRFLAFLLTPGMVNLKAIVNGEVIGTTSLPMKAPVESTGGQYNSNITRIYANQPGDPTPDCTD